MYRTAIFCGMCALAAPLTAEPVRQIAVQGRAEVSAAPDMARVTLGVTAEAPEAGAAMAQMSAQMNAVLALLTGDLSVPARDVQTSELSLSARYRDGKYGQDHAIEGFVARSTVTVTLRDLPQLGSVVDAVVTQGANQIHGLSFAVSNADALRDQARAEAVRDGAARAALLAEAAGVTLGPLLTLSDGAAAPRPAYGAEMRMMSADAPIAAGELTLSASVSMIYQIAD